MSSHLGADLAALVDGELDHDARERVLRHLTRCVECRAEVDAQRRFKDRLRDLSASSPDPAPDLSARLRALAAADLGPALPRGPHRAASRPRSRGDARRPAGRRGRLPRTLVAGTVAARTTVAGAVLVLGLGAVLALGGTHGQPTRAPVDPTGDAFLVDFASTSGELPLPEPAGVSSAGLGR